MDILKIPHAGDILKHEFLDVLGISQNSLAKSLHVPPNRIHAIVTGTRRVTADTDLRLCRFFRLTDGYFLRVQNTYEIAKAKINVADVLSDIHPLISDHVTPPSSVIL